MDNESILTCIKKLIGVAPSYTHFDDQLIVHINAAFFYVYQLGVNECKDFSIDDNSWEWSDLVEKGTLQNILKEIVFLKVKLEFDTSLPSYVQSSIQDQLNEAETRLTYYLEETNE